MKKLLNIWRDLYGGHDLAGSLWRDENRSITFQYNPDYDGEPISVALPLQENPFSEQETRAFFAALNPEGPARQNLVKIVRMDDSEYAPLLERLNDETVGALVFATPGKEPGEDESYLPIGQDFFEMLSESPTSAAVKTLAETRLSLSGAMAKVGLFYDEENREWHLPLGSAPSNFIVKAGGTLFPHETINEAICLDVARRCDFPAADAHLIETASAPLLAVKRYDRIDPDDPRHIDGHAAPLRLHQEDFCQACSLDSMWKYEPTDGHYLNRIVSTASRCCDNSFGEAQLLLDYVVFDYLIGNCDNHLKNYALLYGANWRSKEMAPLYDVLCTTIYPNLLTEMGVSLSPSRSIFGLSRKGLESAIEGAGLPVKIGMGNFDELAGQIVGAIEESRDRLIAEGFPAAQQVADLIIDGTRKRAAFDFSKGNAKTLDLVV